MASDVSQRARDCTREIAHILAPYSAAELDMMLAIVARFEAEIRADATAIERERCAGAVLGGAGYSWEHIADAIRKGPMT